MTADSQKILAGPVGQAGIFLMRKTAEKSILVYRADGLLRELLYAYSVQNPHRIS